MHGSVSSRQTSTCQSFSEPLIFWYEFYRLKIYDFITVSQTRIKKNADNLNIVESYTLPGNHRQYIKGLTLPKGFWQNKFSMAFKQIADANNSVAFIRNVSENWKTSIINHSYIKHWLTLLWVNYKHWPWSLLPFEDSCHSTLFSTMCGRLNASYAFD